MILKMELDEYCVIAIAFQHRDNKFLSTTLEKIFIILNYKL